jgi:SNF2 family DNA or RNA helicase
VNWGEILPALQRLKSPIPIYQLQDLALERVTFNLEKKQFYITSHESKELKIKIDQAKVDSRLSDLGLWLFHPDVGFFVKEVDPFLRQHVYQGEQAAKLLTKYSRILEKYLEGISIEMGFTPVFYDLFFDNSSNLHIAAYLFEKGDLQKSSSAQFDGWVFLQGKGFFLLKNLMFQELEKIVFKKDLGEFVAKNRIWLSQYEGFQIHLAHIECYLSYHVDKWNRLCFKSASGSFDDSVGIIDLHEWIYIEGRGFYAKASSKMPQTIFPGLVIPKEDVSSFIKSHEEDLESIPHFFNLKQPVEKLGLDVFLNKEELITIRPKVSLKKDYHAKQLRFFGDYSFVDKEGFSKLPKGGRIPEIYEQERVLEIEEEEDFIEEQLPILKPLIVSLDTRLKYPKNLHLKLNRLDQKNADSKDVWLFDFGYQSEMGEVSVKCVWEALKKKQRYLKTKAGLLYLQDTRFSWLREISKHHFDEASRLQLTSLEWMRLSLFETVEGPAKDSPNAITTLQYLHEMKHLEVATSFSLEGLKSNLRLYQQTGLKWLWFLYTYGLSGLLCDEMGLGKTHQAMALISACLNRKENPHNKFLVVCPTSVIYHWEELLKNFLPTAKVMVFYGISRSLKGFSERYDILLTSYGTLRSEKEPLSEIKFDVAIYDELHIAKNAHSLTHKALKLMQARMKLGLTGTPIENRLTELHALFDIVLPSYLPQESIYRDFFVLPIEKNQDQEKKKLLSKLIHPFTLRRKKEDVLQELPEKIEEISYVDLSLEQQELYRKLCQSAKAQIYKDVEGQNKEISYMHVFALFNHLKQVCNHPALIHQDGKNYEKYKSGKWDLLVELLQEVRESGQKVVIFSQYLGMLDVIENYLKKENIGYAQIRGSTKNRRQQMQKFKEDPSCEVFLGSLQAAGVGIDLVSASVVIHYDRWWNPAKENQATDRVHRMGQNRGVQVFKLVAKGTIEEHIHYLIQKKTTLLKEIIAYDDQDQIKHLSKQEIIDLLKKIETQF